MPFLLSSAASCSGNVTLVVSRRIFVDFDDRQRGVLQPAFQLLGLDQDLGVHVIGHRLSPSL
jgi:hypothetical protein